MTKPFKISLPDGSVREMEPGATPADVAAAIGPGLSKAAMIARVDGELFDLTRPFEGDAELELVTAKDEEVMLPLIRHDYAHIMAEAVQRLFPGTQITFGPAIEDGFYYDFAPLPSRGPFTEDDLPVIEEEMRRIVAEDKPLKREVWSREQLIKWFKKKGETFKAEWAVELPDDQELTVYWAGDDWLDLCRG
ncbi:MAG: TGS domain-containing protein, partial [Pseudomonadota bacterium]